MTQMFVGCQFLPLLLLLLTATAAAADNSESLRRKAWLIGGIFKNGSENSPDHVAFHLAIEQLQNSNGWFGHLRPKYRYSKTIEYVEDLEDSFQISSAICRLISRGAIVIFGPVHYKTMPMVQSITDHFEIPYITISFVDKLKPDRVVHKRKNWSPAKRQGLYMIRMRPVLTPVVIDFIDHENWERFFFLYDSKSALLRLREIFEAYNSKDATISADIRDLTDDSKGNSKVLQYIDQKSKETLKRVFLDITDWTVQQELFEEIKAIRSSRMNYHYLILGSDMNEVNLTFFRHGGVNITGFTVLNYSNPKFLQFKDSVWFTEARIAKRPTNIDDKDSKHKIVPLKAALMLDSFEAFIRAHHATEMVDPEPRTGTAACMPLTTAAFPAANITAAFKAPNFGFVGITGKVEFDKFGYRTNYRVQVIEAGVKTELLPISEWSPKQGLRITRNLTELRDRGYRLPISNRTRIVTSILGEPFLMLKGNDSFDGTPLVGNDRFEGFCADLIKLLADEIGFDYVIKPVADGKYGDNSVNGTWNGMIGELYRNEADIAVAPLTITSKREKVVDFSKPYMEVGLSIMFLKPTKPESDKFGFMKPLSREIWMCIAFAYLGVSVVLFVVSRFSPYEWHLNQETEADKVINDFSIFNSLWFALSAFMQQGGDISPRSLSGRIVGSVWWFFTLIIVSSYTANLAAFLTVERMSTPIQSYEDLAKQTKIKYGVLNSGSSKEFFKESKIQDFRRMWQFMEANPNVFVNAIKEGVDRVLNSNKDYAFLLESTMNEFYSQQNCKTMKVGGNLDSGRGYGIATPAGSDLREQIDLKVLQLKEKSEINALKTKWWYLKKCPDDDKEDAKKSSAQSLELRSVMGLFYILVVGIIFGVVLSIFEFVYRCALLAKQKKRKFKDVVHEMLVLSARGRMIVDYNMENADLIDNGVNRRFLK